MKRQRLLGRHADEQQPDRVGNRQALIRENPRGPFLNPPVDAGPHNCVRSRETAPCLIYNVATDLSLVQQTV